MDVSFISIRSLVGEEICKAKPVVIFESTSVGSASVPVTGTLGLHTLIISIIVRQSLINAIDCTSLGSATV